MRQIACLVASTGARVGAKTHSGGVYRVDSFALATLMAVAALAGCSDPSPEGPVASFDAGGDSPSMEAGHTPLDASMGGSNTSPNPASDAGAVTDSGAPAEPERLDASADAGANAATEASAGDAHVVDGQPHDAALDASATLDGAAIDSALGPDATTTDAAGPPHVVKLAAGGRQTCALLSSGAVRCWGLGQYGVLGYGNEDSIGDDETPASAGDIALGAPATDIATGYYHTCAVLTGGSVRCWGRNNVGQLGLGHTNSIGDDETPASVPLVDVGGTVVQLAGGVFHTCALLDTGAVRCWGNASVAGQLGYGNSNDIGDDEHPSTAGDVPLGGTALAIVSEEFHTCALLTGGTVRCWGANGSAGCLGYGITEPGIGDDETPESMGDVDVGAAVAQLSLGSAHTCARLSSGAVRCWGEGTGGRLGYSGSETVGDDEVPADVGDVPLGVSADSIAAGGTFTCALSTGNVHCWGANSDLPSGGLGYPGTPLVASADLATVIDVGGAVQQLVAGYNHVCVLLDSGAVRCWGDGTKLGYGNTTGIGDDETPASAGDVSVL